MRELKQRHQGVVQAERVKKPLPKFADLSLHSPKRGKIRPKSAPVVVPKDKSGTTNATTKQANTSTGTRKPTVVTFDDNYDQRPQFSKAALDKMTKVSVQNSKAKQSGNKSLKETADFASKMQQWGRVVASGEKNAKQGSKKQQVAARKVALAEDMEDLLARQGAGVSRSQRRLRTYREKENRARADLDLAVYGETMDNLLE